MWTHVGLMWTHVDSCGLMCGTHVDSCGTHVGLMWTHVGLMWTHVGLISLSLGEVFQFSTLWWIWGWLRDVDENYAFREAVDSAGWRPQSWESEGL